MVIYFGYCIEMAYRKGHRRMSRNAARASRKGGLKRSRRATRKGGLKRGGLRRGGLSRRVKRGGSMCGENSCQERDMAKGL